VQINSTRWILVAGVAVLATVGSVMNQHSNIGSLHAADGGPTVTVGGPLPLPTTAAQNGVWNVGITGTPSVSISGTPNVAVTGTPNVSVTNHVAIRNVDEKGRIPYMQTTFQSCAPTSGLCDLNFPAVAAGKRLVVERVSANIGLNPGSGLNATFLGAPGGVFFSLPGRAMASPTLIGVNEGVLAYYDAGQAPLYRLAFAAVGDSGVVSAVISGYLVDLSQ
jgi:hypothetical protein